MRRTVLLVTAMALTLLVASGVALAVRPTHNVCDTWLSQDWRETA
jgi:hypothetical protein